MKRPVFSWFLALTSGLWLAGCDAADPMNEVPDKPRPVAETDYLVALSGLKSFDFVVGDGPSPVIGRRVVVHYTGWLTDGTRFDTSLDGDPFEYVYGLGQVIAGWDEGIQTMQVGGDRQLVIPPGLAYGASGRGSIPPNATLIFEIELLVVR